MMNELSHLEAATFTDGDVAWACDVLRLPRTAFRGLDGKDLRLGILKSATTLDIEACPGSGKTTLLIAKLAVLARKWTDSRCGLCVLSHTNVARREIEQRLGNTSEGKRLLSYPHFVGTIHGFVNTFLAIPWLRSLGYPIRVIDDGQCEQHRRRLLGLPRFRALATSVSRIEGDGKLNIVSKWHLASPRFDVLKDNGKPEFKDPTKPSSKQLRGLVEQCLRDGYYRYDELFMWAHDLLDNCTDVRETIRTRFPMLFMDEVQDNSEKQSALLFRLFVEGKNPVLRQRFGDVNQAIYQNATQTDGATTDCFPNTLIRRDIPDSHRFGQEIGKLADPLALEPQGLTGCGPPSHVIKSNTAGKNTIFLFRAGSMEHVIGTYAGYLQEVFSEKELSEGTFTAVGSIHRPKGADHPPRCVGEYWREYNYKLAGAEPGFKTFLEYLTAGRRRADSSGEAFHIVEKIADGLLRLARLGNPTLDLSNRKHKHRYVLELLAKDVQARATYIEFLTLLAAERSMPSRGEWVNRWSVAVADLVEIIGGKKVDRQEAAAFLEWQRPQDMSEDMTLVVQRDNLFRHPAATPKVRISVGSIHSVKGETHTATLVMETYYHGHHLAALRPWLLGQRSGKGKEGIINRSRLKQHYVAMTRPTHLLCLAMKEDGFTDQEMDLLKGRGWRLARVTDGTPEWL